MYRQERTPVERPVFPDYSATVPGMLRALHERYGSKDCVVTPDDRMTFADLDRLSRRLAARLVEAGVAKGSRVGVLFPNSTYWVIAWAAAARLGAVVVPVNTFYKSRELGSFLHHSDIQYLIGVSSFLQHDYLERLETLAPELTTARPPLYLESFPQLRRVLLWGESDRPWAEPHTGHLTESHPLEPLVEQIGHDVAPGDEMLVTYTSGTTAEPKGVVHSHGAVIRHARNLAALSGVDETTRIWTPMPMCWVGGFVFSLVRAMCVGGCLVTQETLDPGAALKLFERERVTNASAWPAVTKSFVQHPDFATTDLSSLRGGSFYAALPPDQRPPDEGLAVGSLGMSETCGPHTFWTAGEEITGAPEEYRGTFGHEVPGTEHKIIDPDTGEEMKPGEEGEVLVRGYNLMLGLYKKERSEVFDADGWYHTGDRGYFRDGWFFFTGRQSELIKTKGSNVAPAEVERCLMELPEVKLAFVVGVSHPERGQDVVALVVPWQSSADADTVAMREQLREELSSYKVPRHIFLIEDEAVPWLVSQKADRRALATLAEKLVGQLPARDS